MFAIDIQAKPQNFITWTAVFTRQTHLYVLHEKLHIKQIMDGKLIMAIYWKRFNLFVWKGIEYMDKVSLCIENYMIRGKSFSNHFIRMKYFRMIENKINILWNTKPFFVITWIVNIINILCSLYKTYYIDIKKYYFMNIIITLTLYYYITIIAFCHHLCISYSHLGV